MNFDTGPMPGRKARGLQKHGHSQSRLKFRVGVRSANNPTISGLKALKPDWHILSQGNLEDGDVPELCSVWFVVLLSPWSGPYQEPQK